MKLKVNKCYAKFNDIACESDIITLLLYFG